MSVQPFVKHVDFTSCTIESLQLIEMHFEHQINKTGILHGYGLYFDAYFKGSNLANQVVLSTAPESAATHWYQCRLLMREPIGVNRGQKLSGSLKLAANKEQSFDGTLIVNIPTLNIKTTNHYDMKDLNYRGTYQSYVDYYASVNQQ